MIGAGTRFEHTDYTLLGRVLAEKRRLADMARREGEFRVVGKVKIK